MKPYPFASLNHLTVPVAIKTPPQPSKERAGRRGTRNRYSLVYVPRLAAFRRSRPRAIACNAGGMLNGASPCPTPARVRRSAVLGRNRRKGHHEEQLETTARAVALGDRQARPTAHVDARGDAGAAAHERAPGLMSSKRQQTWAKRDREQTTRERREAKQQKKHAAAAARHAAKTEPGSESVEGVDELLHEG